MKWFKRILLLLLVVIALVVYLNYPKLNMISGYASKYMASQVYIAERQPNAIIESDLQFPLIELAETEVDNEETSASATVYGLMERKAIDRQGLGCVLVNGDYAEGEPYLQPKRNFSTLGHPYPFGHLPAIDTVFAEIDYEQLQKAVALPFTNNAVQKTRTLLVLYKGHLLHEHYVEGFTKDTPVLGWSMTKSVLATFFGILEHQKRVDMDWPAPIPEWKDDGRKDITLDHLLRMQSGLAWEEVYTEISDVTQMLFLDSDMTEAQKNKEAVAKPTEIWNYSSGTSNLLSGILRMQFRSYQEYLDFPYQSLIDKIGMHSMLIEADLAGNYVGSSYAWASTRDWARFGQLYLNKGEWNGEQLFSPQWAEYVSTPTQHSDGRYGAHFWLNAGGVYPDVPKDLYSCNGYQGQYVFIIPSKELVVVRTGLAEDPDFDINGFLGALVKAIR
ncbi:serine hydrolase domain-containing protein [Allomuricauda sp. SCSIO 65647]|uniref:serine hydrolase domain-containing protein n=1 Tax=Allomuricauda sp. SCSIO 65647 TaxID=2908843 RepID=UPI001F2FA829|nr:serine hydrolase [Muricauda sp. SCSIO 65647]UJH67296.1 beta-lactamase family protein [Muricauda sp. SCSIO 65647]